MPAADRRVEAADAGAAGPDRLGERPLRHERRLDLALVHGGDRLGVRGEVRRDPAADPPLPQELAEPAARLADVVRHDRQVGRVGVVDERVDQGERRPDEAEAAHHHGVARADVGDRLLGAGITALAVTPSPVAGTLAARHSEGERVGSRPGP